MHTSLKRWSAPFAQKLHEATRKIHGELPPTWIRLLRNRNSIEGGKEQAKLTPSWKRSTRNSILHFQWALDYVPGSHGDKIPTAERPPRLINTRFHTRSPITKKNAITLYVVKHLCNLYGIHWCRRQCITNWPFWLWIMAVTWLYLPLTLSRLGLRNLGMWAWKYT